MGPPENTWPLCLACWRLGVSMALDPPRSPGWPEERCTVCDRRTNQGIHVDEATLRDAVVLLVRAGVIHSSRSLVIQRETVGGREDCDSHNANRQALATPAYDDPFALEDMCDAED